MFLPVFDNMTAAEINEYTKINYDSKDELRRLEDLVPLYKLSFFGPQFTNTQSEYLVLYRNQEFQFIWKNDFRDPLSEARIPFDEFRRVFEEYIEYCAQQKLV